MPVSTHVSSRSRQSPEEETVHVQGSGRVRVVGYPVSPEAEEGQTDGAWIPGAGCLVTQGACVKHSVDETDAGGQCWRLRGPQRCMLTAVTEAQTRDAAGLDEDQDGSNPRK